jgi:DNA-binding NarL/FixJ family response regulator
MLGETFLPATVLAAISDDVDDEEDDDWPNDGKTAEKLLEPEGGNAPQLSARERSILQCLIGGDSNKIIARKINIAEATVKVHVKAILRKIRVHNRTQAAIWAMSNAFSSSAMSNSLPAPDTAQVRQPLVRVLPSIRRNGSAF